MDRNRTWSGLIACAIVLGIVGCGSDRDAPATIAGLWLLTHDDFDCEFFPAALTNGKDIRLDQVGERVTANATENDGSSITFDGQYSDGILAGQLTVVESGGRTVLLSVQLFFDRDDSGVPMADGVVRMLSDSAGLCVSNERIGAWLRLTDGSTSSPGEVFTQCGPVDIVFMMDTSSSMDDESAALCAQIDQVFANLENLGLTDVRIFKWGITADRDDEPIDFPCLTDNVYDIFTTPEMRLLEVPGWPGRFILSDSDEDWGPGTAVVSTLGSAGRNANFQWRPGAVKILVPISDEGPSDGNPDNADDTLAIDNAIVQANANGIIVSPIVATGARPAVANHARNLAQGTGGIAVHSSDPDLDIGGLIFDIVFVACGGTLDPLPDPEPFVGDTMLVAAGRDGGIYRIDPQTGAATFMMSTPISVIGVQELTFVSSMVYNEGADQLWAGTGGNSAGACPGCIFRIGRDGIATELSNNLLDIDAHSGLTQRRSDGTIFGTEGSDDDLYIINEQSGAAFQYTNEIAGDDYEEGNGLTFLGDVLYWASENRLFTLDQFTGGATELGVFTFANTEPFTNFTIVAMTSPPGSGTIYAILKDKSNTTRQTFVCTIDVGTLAITILGAPVVSADGPGLLLEGIAWVPVDYFGSQ